MYRMLLAGRLQVPATTRALLFDMDGVLLDSLAHDYDVVEALLLRLVGINAHVPQSFIRANFAVDIPEFWRRVLIHVKIAPESTLITRLTEAHHEAREQAVIPLHEGVMDLLKAARAQNLRIAVVSNNPSQEVKRMLALVGVDVFIDEVVGNDQPGLRKKPAPDPYLEAVRRFGLSAHECVVLEDSLLGVQAGKEAGCYTIAVATGANRFEDLEPSQFADMCYLAFKPSKVDLGRLGVTTKVLNSPNDFVSHMVEHIAWRLGCSIDLSWNNNDWMTLGLELGKQVAMLPQQGDESAALGMIDDGSAEIVLTRSSGVGSTFLSASKQVDLDWFLGLRCEQLADGRPLVGLLNGLSKGSGFDISITVASAEDPHHTWEGIFRGIGIAMNRLCLPNPQPKIASEGDLTQKPHRTLNDPGNQYSVERGWVLQNASVQTASLSRETAESIVAVELSLGEPSLSFKTDVADSIHVEGMQDLLAEFAQGANLQLKVKFIATKLSSSHVVAEDIGMALGRAIRAIAVERMMEFGIQGAGSNLKNKEDLDSAIRVGVSMEGRKFWKFVPFATDYPEFRKSFLIGHTLSKGVFSEDLDDFIDGFAGGLSASVMVHIERSVSPDQGWANLMHGLGVSVDELLSINADRKRLAPGVKATLA